MMRLKRCIAIKGLSAVLLFACLPVWADQAGAVTHLSGPLFAKKQDGTRKVLAQKSTVEQGDTLVSEKNTYARIKFIDNSEITLRPNSQFKIDRFSFEQEKPENDSAFFKLIKGGLRAVTGALGKRNRERFGLATPTATIGIRGTIFIAEYIPSEVSSTASTGFTATAALASADSLQKFIASTTPEALLALNDATPLPSLMPASIGGVASEGGKAPGLYVQVLDGMIHLSNHAGTQNFSSGQFGYTPSITQTPIVLPSNPGIQFSPPPAFQVSHTAPSSGTEKQAGNVSCEVR